MAKKICRPTLCALRTTIAVPLATKHVTSRFEVLRPQACLAPARKSRRGNRAVAMKTRCCHGCSKLLRYSVGKEGRNRTRKDRRKHIFISLSTMFVDYGTPGSRPLLRVSVRESYCSFGKHKAIACHEQDYHLLRTTTVRHHLRSTA